MDFIKHLGFCGGALERAAHLRGDADEMAALAAHPATRGLAIWRGKPLIAGDSVAMAQLKMDNPLFANAGEAPVFLGLGASGALFSFDVSSWQPEVLPDVDPGLMDMSQLHHPDLPRDHRFVDLRSVMARLSPADGELAASAKAILGWHENHGYCAKCGAKTGVSMAGWQRQCAKCGMRHFPRTDPVVIMLVTHGNSVLLGRSPGWPEGMFSLLAGFVEPGETLEMAVRREVLEETAVTVGAVGYLASQPWPFPASLMVGCRAEALSLDITIDPVEIEAAMWISREQLMDVFAGNDETIMPARPGSIAHYLLQNWLADALE
jgi:NAD+ diphosphatase